MDASGTLILNHRCYKFLPTAKRWTKCIDEGWNHWLPLVFIFSQAKQHDLPPIVLNVTASECKLEYAFVITLRPGADQRTR